MVGSREYGGARWRAVLAVLFAALMPLLLVVGTARANPTAVDFGPGDATVTGPTPVTMGFPFGRVGDLGYDVWLRYRTANGTATAGTDYTAAEGEVEVPAGSSGASIPVGILGKSAFAPEKQFAFQLSSATAVGPTPTFAERVTFAGGADISARAKVGDLNGDGRPDLIVPNNTAATVSVLLDTTAPGSSTPSFAAAQSVPVGSGPEPATPADVNGDGRPDLVVADGTDDEFSVLINTTPPGASTVSFGPEAVFEAGRGPHHPLLADINGDGRPDLIVTNDQFDEHAVSVFFNTTPPGAATASFGPRQYFEFFAPSSALAADINGDGRPDLIFSSQAGANEVVAIINETPPGGSALVLGSEADLPVDDQPNIVRAADLNGDGKPDLAVSTLEGKSASILLNETVPGASTPSFAPQQSFKLIGGATRSIQAVDLNGDGRPDLVTGDPEGHDLTVMVNTTPTGSMRTSFAKEAIEAEPLPLGLSAADFNGDGRPDLTYTRSNGKVSVALNTTPRPTAAAPSLAAKGEAPAGADPSSVAADDFNGDGRPDLAVSDHGEAAVSVLLGATPPGASAPSFGNRQAFAAGDGPAAVAAADFNLDGRPDLAVADEGSDAASVLLDTTVAGATTPSFAAGPSFATGDGPSAVAAADFNGDGKPDLAVADRGADDVAVLLDSTAPGASSPSFSSAHDFSSGEAPTSVVAIDVNLDGRPDLIVANHDEDTVAVLINTTPPGASTPSFARELTLATGSLPSSVASTDLNGDGRPDLVVANEGSDTVSVRFNTTAPGATPPSFATPQTFAVGTAPSSVATADLDGDGIPDLLVAEEAADSESVLLNTTEPGSTTPAFADPVAFAAGAAPTAVTTADLNGDGGPDAIAADGGGDAVSALLDTQYAATVVPASVTGTIRYAIPMSDVTPNSLDFGPQPLGATTTRTVTVANEGGAALTIDGIAIAPGAAGFGETNDCPGALAAGASCGVTVSFRPGAAGTVNAALTVTTDAPTGPTVVALSGRGVAPPSGGEGAPPPSPRAVAHLRIRKVSRRASNGRVRIAVRGTIAAGARGRVTVQVRSRVGSRRQTATGQATIAGGVWSTQLVLPARIASASSLQIAAKFAGSPGFDAGQAERRLEAR